MKNLARTAPGSGRFVTILGGVAAGIGLVGFLIGIAEPVHATRSGRQPDTQHEQDALPAPGYQEIHSAVHGPNADWHSNFAALRQDPPDLFAPVTRTPAMKEAALEDRLRTRAFDGAPPVIPHAVEQQSAASCLVCHGNGWKLGDRIASRVSHPHFANCLQCHVEQSGHLPVSVPDASRTSIINEFAGLMRSGPGSRAMSGAPPTIPHATHLRSDCMSCHGLVARPGLRTTHPWLQNCVQCHVAAAAADRPAMPGTDLTSETLR